MSAVVSRGDIVMKAGEAFDELVNWMNLLGVEWWVRNGWSVRKVGQEELNGSGRKHQPQEPGEAGLMASAMAPRVDAGDGESRASVEADVTKRVFAALARQALSRKTSSRPRGRRPRRRRGR